MAESGIRCWADNAYQGAGRHIRVPFRGRRLKRWKRRHNTTHAEIRCVGEQAMASRQRTGMGNGRSNPRDAASSFQRSWTSPARTSLARARSSVDGRCAVAERRRCTNSAV
ncbi:MULTISPECIES: hypothetical protein [unclassified Streptomyces]|uniref:hypothetical protein n=1 Tax=unclassified Streptomyces TaxID=2593676 RepID=UPI00386A5574